MFLERPNILTPDAYENPRLPVYVTRLPTPSEEAVIAGLMAAWPDSASHCGLEKCTGCLPIAHRRLEGRVAQGVGWSHSQSSG